MKRFIEAADRGQSTLFPECLEDWVVEDNPIRVIDVFVEEPPGSVCSQSMPRTLAGGVLLADEAAGADRAGKTHKERYVVAEAFPGRYRVLVRRVFGKVAADTVTVRTTIRARADNEETKTSPLRLAGNEQTTARVHGAVGELCRQCPIPNTNNR